MTGFNNIMRQYYDYLGLKYEPYPLWVTLACLSFYLD